MPQCGQRVPDTEIIALVSKTTAQWSLSRHLRVARVAAPPQQSDQKFPHLATPCSIIQ